jgi:hypothetical protein
MMAAAEPFDPPAPGPPACYGPVRRPLIPEPDWREEERRRLEKGAP